MKMKAFIATFIAAALVTACAATDSSSTATNSTDSRAQNYRSVAEIQDSGFITIGVFSDKLPFGYVNSSGEYAGYDIEYGNRIGQDLNVAISYVPVEAASRVEFLSTNKVDLILANFTVTPQRAEKVDFAQPYMKVSLGLVSPDSKPINDEADLVGKNIIVVKGTTAETYLESTYPELKLQKYDQYTEATNALADGRGDAWVTDNTEALAWVENNNGFSTTITSLGNVDTIAGAVAKGNTSLLNWLNDELIVLGEENFFHKNFTKTLQPVYGDQINPDELVVEGGQL
ncbi:transporter substrate-binding domain-containing protein [Corynebacterium kutscheri]|nr:transporter substrate-binding domain-containing protein [Corynebacterium kutscheri]